MSLTNPLATTLSQVFSASARPAAEYSFSQLQNTYINRLNVEIGKVNDVRGDVALERKILRENQTLSSQVNSVNKYIYDNQSNLGKLGELATMVSDLGDIFSSDGNALDVTAQEQTDFIAKRDEVVAKIRGLYNLSHPNVADFGRIRDLMEQADTLENFTPDVGAIDPSDAANPNNNRQITDFLLGLANKTSVAITVTEDTVYLGNQMSTTFQQKLLSNQANLLEMNEVDQADRTRQIEDLKIEYANLLKAISISQEVALSYSEGLAKSLNGSNLPEPGSVLNLFG